MNDISQNARQILNPNDGKELMSAAHNQQEAS